MAYPRDDMPREVSTPTRPVTAPRAPGRGQVRAFGSYQPGLDGLRGFTIFCVLFYHARLGPYDGMYLSLSLFFVLSGFLITAILLNDRHRAGRIDFKRFWSRRVRRLAPAALLGVLLAVIYGATLATRSQAEQLPGDLVGVIFYVVNWTFIATEQSYTDIFAAPSPVQHYWSLAVEEQFYLIIPLSLGFLLRFKVPYRWVVGILGAGVIASTLWMLYLHNDGIDIDRLYFGTDTRIAEVLVGVMLAVVMDRREGYLSERTRQVFGYAGFLAIGGLLWLWFTIGVTESFSYRGGFLLNSLLTAVLIMAIVSDRGPLSHVFRWSPAVRIGRFSYGIYIYHFVIFLWLTPERTGLDPWPNCALRFAVTLAVSWASYHYIETPVRNGASLGLSRSGRVLFYPVTGVALIIAANVTANTDGADPLATLRAENTSFLAPVATSDGVLDILVIHSEENEEIVEHLEDVVADDDGVDIVATERFTCEGGVVDYDGSPTCANWAQDWPRLIEEHDPDTVLLFVEWWAGDEPGSLEVAGAESDRAKVGAVVDTGFDILTSNGAAIASVGAGQTAQVQFQRGVAVLYQALADLGSKPGVNLVPTGAMPNPSTTTPEEYLQQSADRLVEVSALYQRADREGAARVLVIGDSQARSLGYGLERWGADQGIWVWNVATNGCGLADEGFKVGTGEEEPIRPECVTAVAALESQVASFDPDMVIVLSSVWDIGPRRLDDWSDVLPIGEPAFNDYLVREYQTAAETLTSSGAKVVWMQAPCLDTGSGVDQPVRRHGLDRQRGARRPQRPDPSDGRRRVPRPGGALRPRGPAVPRR